MDEVHVNDLRGSGGLSLASQSASFQSFESFEQTMLTHCKRVHT